MKSPQRIVTSAVFTFCCVSPALLQADGWTRMEHASIDIIEHGTQLGDNRITIESDGSQYTGPAEGVAQVNAVLDVQLMANFASRIKGWSAWIKSRTVNAEEVHLNPRANRSYPLGSRPRGVDRQESIDADFTAAGVFHCNALASRLRRQGLSNAAIFAEDRTIAIGLEPALTYDVVGLASNEPNAGSLGHDWAQYHAGLPQLELVCLAHANEPNTPTEDLLEPQSASIAFADLTLSYDDQPTECPTRVDTFALLSGNSPGTFVIRYESLWGSVSQSLELTMGPADFNGTHYTKLVEDSFQIGGSSDASWGGGEQQGAQGMQIVLGDDIDSNHQQTWAQGGDAYADAAGGREDLSDSLRIEIVSAGMGSVSASDYVDYQIICQPGEMPGSSQPGMPGELAPVQLDNH